VSGPDTQAFRRAPGAPELPDTPHRFIWHFVNRYRGWYALMLFFETVNAACGITVPYALGRIVKAVSLSAAQTPQIIAMVATPLALFTALSVGEVVFGRLAGAVQIRLGPRQRQNVTREVYHYLQHHSHRYLSENFAGALAHRISETSMGVTQTLWSVITEFWPITIVISVAVGLLFQAHVQLGLFALTWAVFFIGVSYVLARRCQPKALHAAHARSETTGAIVDSVTNLTSARLFARLGFERQNLEAHLTREMGAIRISNGYNERVRWFQFTAAALLKIGLLYFSLTLWGRGQISVAEFVMATSLSLLVINEARNLSRRFLEIFEHVGNVSHGVYSIVRSHELVDAPDALPARLQSGAVHFDRVSFAYPGGRQVFEQLDVKIPAGQHVGLVGTSGSGKSSFVNLLLRLYDPQGGRVLVDGHDVKQLTQEALHSQVSLIPQDPSLFHRTLMENIRYGRIDATDDEVAQAAQRAHAHEFIAQIPGGYEALVGERGVKLSGGQRQRIAIARVIVKNAPILILDEATSALDSITEKVIQDTLDEVTRDKTVIVVAHRLSTVAQMDRILVFDEGRIIEDGSPAQLLAQGGAYFRLWSRQAGGFADPPSEADEAADDDLPDEGPSRLDVLEAHADDLVREDEPTVLGGSQPPLQPQRPRSAPGR
jgi:ATP-binding cassette subfamily B protein